MKNCAAIGRSRPSSDRIWAMSASEAELPAITAAGSPGLNRSIRNTSTATMTTTGTTAATRRQRHINTMDSPAFVDAVADRVAVAAPGAASKALRADRARRARLHRRRARSTARLFDVPEDRDRRAEHAGDALAHR